jgi:3-methyladenine DNA glycosylase/8-oxoguanine DNA glycosylase
MPLSLGPVFTANLEPCPPFSFEATVHKPSHFPTPIEAFEPAAPEGGQRSYWQTLRWNDEPLGLRLIEAGCPETPAVDLTVFAKSPLADTTCAAIMSEVRRRFDLDADLAPFERRCGADRLLAPALERRRGMRIKTGGSLYEMLVIYVVLQNATVRRSVQMTTALLERYGTSLAFDGRRLYAFWPPEALAAVPEEELRGLKVGYRARTLKRLSAAFAAGEVDTDRLHQLSNEEARRELLKLYGIGPASVWYLLFEVLHRYDALDHVSPWEQRIYSRLFFDEELVPTDRIIDEAKRRWGPWRMLAAHYLFEDLFWQRRQQAVPWLEELIRL